MKQIRITAPYTFQTEEAPPPEISGSQALLKIDCLGICASDMQIYQGKHKFMTFPVILGHEAAATVQKTGSGVKDFQAGDKVTIQPQVFCGECYPCKHGRPNVCEKLNVMGVHSDGFSREYVAIDAAHLHKAPANLGAQLISMAEPLAVGVSAARRASNLAGANVAVVGAGTIGNFTAQCAKALGAKSVLIADIAQWKLDWAKECGIDFCANTEEKTLKDAIRESFGADRADIIIDCAATGAAFKSVMEAARQFSQIIITGNYKEPVELFVPVLQRQEISIIGHMMYSHDDFKTAIDLLAGGKIACEKTASKIFGFDEYEAAFKYACANAERVMKLLIKL